MKLLTHKLVIYDKGWQFKWEKKEPSSVTVTGTEVLLFCWILYLIFF